MTKFQIDWEEGQSEDQNVGIAPDMGAMMGGQELQNAEGIMAKGTQVIDRNDMMSHANLQEAKQNFIQ